MLQNVINKSEHGYWDNLYQVWLSEYNELYVYADWEGTAMDIAMDYAEEQGWEGLFLQDEDIEKLRIYALADGFEEWDFVDEHYQGGNHNRWLSSFNVGIRLYARRNIVMSE